MDKNIKSKEVLKEEKEKKYNNIILSLDNFYNKIKKDFNLTDEELL